MMIEILKSQHEASNATVCRLNAPVAGLQQTISDLRKTVANLESLLKERDENMDRANARMRGIKATFLPKRSEKRPRPASPKTEERAAEERAGKEKLKARGNNGAKRKDYFAIKEISENVYPQDIAVEEGVEIGVRDVIRYEMIRPGFIKHVYHVHTLKKGDLISSGKAPLAPLQNSRFDGFLHSRHRRTEIPVLSAGGAYCEILSEQRLRP